MPSLLIVATVPEAIRGFLLPYATHFRRLGWRVDAAASGISAWGDCVSSFDHVWDIGWSRSPLDIAANYRAVGHIRDAVCKGRYDIVHVHTPIASFVTRLSLRHLRLNGLFVVYTAHGFHFHVGGSATTNLIYRTAERAAARWTDHIIVINDEDYEAARRNGLMPQHCLTLMPGIGLDIEYYGGHRIPPTAVGNVRSEFGLAADDSLFVCIAEFTPNKRHIDIVRALAGLKRSDIHVAFCGTGPTLDAVRSLSVHLNVERQVHFAGFRQDVPVLLKAARATLLVSAREGYPRSVMESFAAGTPVIGTNVRGTRSLIKDGCGILVDLACPRQIADALLSLHRHPEEATRMGNTARDSVAGCDIHKVLEMHERIYAGALRRRSVPAVA